MGLRDRIIPIHACRHSSVSFSISSSSCKSRESATSKINMVARRGILRCFLICSYPTSVISVLRNYSSRSKLLGAVHYEAFKPVVVDGTFPFLGRRARGLFAVEPVDKRMLCYVDAFILVSCYVSLFRLCSQRCNTSCNSSMNSVFMVTVKCLSEALVDHVKHMR